MENHLYFFCDLYPELRASGIIIMMSKYVNQKHEKEHQIQESAHNRFFRFFSVSDTDNLLNQYYSNSTFNCKYVAANHVVVFQPVPNIGGAIFDLNLGRLVPLIHV